MEWTAGNILDQRTLCTELLRLEVLRGQLVSQLSPKDSNGLAVSRVDIVPPWALPHLLFAGRECCQQLRSEPCPVPGIWPSSFWGSPSLGLTCSPL